MKITDHILDGTDRDNLTFVRSGNSSSGILPVYLIIHYTGSTTLASALSWFQNPEARASAHLVIDRDGSVVQMVEFNRRAWHAGKSTWGNLDGLNRYSIGIELVNAGKLKKNASGQWISWSNELISASDVTIAKHRDETIEAGWHEYPEAQIESTVKICALLNDVYQFADILGHDDVSPGRKVDPGPLFPMNNFRSIVLGRV